jgi:taurine dioxygenase
MALDIEPIGKTFGARVHGVDFSQDLDAATLEAVRQAWLERRVLAFPDQHLSEPQLLGFSRLFGPLEKHVRSEYHHER